MVDHIFFVGFVVLGATVGIAAFLIGYEQIYISPLAEAEREQYLAMDCDELKKFTAEGRYWSPQNSQEARELVRACK